MLQGMLSGGLLIAVFAAVATAGIGVAIRLYRGTRPAGPGRTRPGKPGAAAKPNASGGSLHV